MDEVHNIYITAQNMIEVKIYPVCHLYYVWFNNILLLVRIPSEFAFISVHYLLNRLMDFDQTCIDTLLGGG